MIIIFEGKSLAGEKNATLTVETEKFENLIKFFPLWPGAEGQIISDIPVSTSGEKSREIRKKSQFTTQAMKYLLHYKISCYCHAYIVTPFFLKFFGFLFYKLNYAIAKRGE